MLLIQWSDPTFKTVIQLIGIQNSKHHTHLQPFADIPFYPFYITQQPRHCRDFPDLDSAASMVDSEQWQQCVCVYIYIYMYITITEKIITSGWIPITRIEKIKTDITIPAINFIFSKIGRTKIAFKPFFFKKSYVVIKVVKILY
jgi:hypothetical protein